MPLQVNRSFAFVLFLSVGRIFQKAVNEFGEKL